MKNEQNIVEEYLLKDADIFIEIYEYVLVKMKDTKIRRTDMNLRRNLSWKN